MRQIVLDTETTGLDASAGHRIIEVGGIEFDNRRPTGRTFHRYVNPERAVDPGALAVHGIDNEFLKDQPVFAAIADELVEFLNGAELVIHNADFDVTFINHELRRLPQLPQDIRACCTVLDSLAVARRMHPGQRNNLDALARRYHVDNSKRELHGALLDAQILAEVYFAMTGGQVSLLLDAETNADGGQVVAIEREAVSRDKKPLRVIHATPEEAAAHAAFLRMLSEKSGTAPLWAQLGIDRAPAIRPAGSGQTAATSSGQDRDAAMPQPA
jgi:DNA polymerase-3 subunit epsilon